MKSFLIGVLTMLLFHQQIFSQSTATEGKMDYQRGERPVVMIELPYSPEIVEGALKSKLSSVGVKEERLKGLQVFKGARLSPTDGEIVDLYFKVEKKSKRDNHSIVNLILGRPNENVAMRQANDLYRMEDGKNFLNNLAPDVEAYQLERDIEQQEELIKKSEKSVQGLLNDQKILEEKVRDLQDRITQNKADQQNANAELNRLRTVRDALLSKRITGK